jgi:hypothetical protein
MDYWIQFLVSSFVVVYPLLVLGDDYTQTQVASNWNEKLSIDLRSPTLVGYDLDSLFPQDNEDEEELLLMEEASSWSRYGMSMSMSMSYPHLLACNFELVDVWNCTLTKSPNVTCDSYASSLVDTTSDACHVDLRIIYLLKNKGASTMVQSAIASINGSNPWDSMELWRPHEWIQTGEAIMAQHHHVMNLCSFFSQPIDLKVQLVCSNHVATNVLSDSLVILPQYPNPTCDCGFSLVFNDENIVSWNISAGPDIPILLDQITITSGNVQPIRMNFNARIMNASQTLIGSMNIGSYKHGSEIIASLEYRTLPVMNRISCAVHASWKPSEVLTQRPTLPPPTRPNYTPKSKKKKSKSKKTILVVQSRSPSVEKLPNHKPTNPPMPPSKPSQISPKSKKKKSKSKKTILVAQSRSPSVKKIPNHKPTNPPMPPPSEPSQISKKKTKSKSSRSKKKVLTHSPSTFKALTNNPQSQKSTIKSKLKSQKSKPMIQSPSSYKIPYKNPTYLPFTQSPSSQKTKSSSRKYRNSPTNQPQSPSTWNSLKSHKSSQSVKTSSSSPSTMVMQPQKSGSKHYSEKPHPSLLPIKSTKISAKQADSPTVTSSKVKSKAITFPPITSSPTMNKGSVKNVKKEWKDWSQEKISRPMKKVTASTHRR